MAHTHIVMLQLDETAELFRHFLSFPTGLNFDTSLPARELNDLLKLLVEWECEALHDLALRQLEDALHRKTINPLKLFHVATAVDSASLQRAALCAMSDCSVGVEAMYRNEGQDPYAPGNWPIKLWRVMSEGPATV